MTKSKGIHIPCPHGSFGQRGIVCDRCKHQRREIRRKQLVAEKAAFKLTAPSREQAAQSLQELVRESKGKTK
jgi:hypothetical protein